MYIFARLTFQLQYNLSHDGCLYMIGVPESGGTVLSSSLLALLPHGSRACMICGCLQMESNLDAYNVWYPPVRSSLLCLSKLYGCVDPKIFNGLAQDAVHAATASVQVSQHTVIGAAIMCSASTCSMLSTC